MSDVVPDYQLLRLSVDIVSAYVTHHTIAADELPEVTRSVYVALSQAATPPEPKVSGQKPAVPIKASVFPSQIVCLEDGKKLILLKRYLRTRYDMTPNQYRAKWRLPASYPMTAPDYAAKRSRLTRNRFGRQTVEAAAEVPVQRIPLGVKGKKPKPTRQASTAIDAPGWSGSEDTLRPDGL